jgi:hypothetical protein
VNSFRWVIRAVFVVIPGQSQAAGCPSPDAGLLLDSCETRTRADLILLDPDDGVPAGLLDAQQTTLVVTGAYTSGEKVEPEGFVLDHGSPYDPYIQGWDGLMLITPEGDLSLHHVARVKFRGSQSNLRDRAQRRAFVVRAKQLGLSAIQSHLLITDGNLDVRNVAGAPRFRRRIVFSYKDGGYGIFDSGPRALTLFEAATEVAKQYAPHMAFNLDMGSYDYCAMTREGRTSDCGSLDRSQTAKLSNILVFTQD